MHGFDMKSILIFIAISLAFFATLFTAGCSRSPKPSSGPHPRIIAFSPALAAILFDMGLGDHVVGVSEYTVLPEGETRPFVGSAKVVRAEPILALEPDVILTQSEPRYYETVQSLRPDLAVEHFSLTTLEEVAAAMERIGQIVHQPELGQSAAAAFRARLAKVEKQTQPLPRRRVVFMMDYQHPFAAGRETFLDEMIRLAGGVNALAETRDWHKPSLESLLAARPDVIVCQCKPEQTQAAKQYWTDLLAKVGVSARVYTVTDNTWTIAAGHLAAHTEKLAKMIHPTSGDVKP